MSTRLVLLLILTGCCAEVHGRLDDVIMDRIVAFPEPHATDSLLLRNTDIRKDKSNAAAVLVFGQEKRCNFLTVLPPGGVIELAPKTESNPCGFPFGISTAYGLCTYQSDARMRWHGRDQLHLFNDEDVSMGFAEWSWSLPGLSLRHGGDGDYAYHAENKPVAQLMEEEYPELSLCVQALQAAGLWETVWQRSVHRGRSFSFSSNELLPFQLPSQYRLPRKQKVMDAFYSEMPQNASIFPFPGRLTVLCPTNEAMESFYKKGIFSQGRTAEEIRQLSEFHDLMQFHILPGEWTTGYLMDGIEIRTALPDTNVTLLHRIEQKGRYQFGTGCQEEEFDASSRCPCSFSCSSIVQPDIYAANGVLHIVDRVLLPQSLAEKHLPEKNVANLDDQAIENAEDDFLDMDLDFLDDHMDGMEEVPVADEM